MNKEQYLNWIKTRGPVGEWKHEDCHAADELIKTTTFANFERYLQTSRIEPKMLRDYILQTADLHFGAVETDQLLVELGMYPDWMK